MRYLSLSLLLGTSLLANGFSGDIGIVGAHFVDKDNFSDHKKNKIISSLDGPKNYSENMFLPNVNLNYNGFFLHTDLEDDFGVKAGYALDSGTSVFALTNGFGLEYFIAEYISIKLKQTKNDMYVNPYLTQEKRQKKEATNNTLAFKAELDFVNIEYEYLDIDMKDEVNEDAKQSGNSHDFSLVANIIPFNSFTFGGFGVVAGKGDFEGDSNDYDKLGLKFNMFMELNEHILMFEYTDANYDFDTKNSYFNEIRDENEKEYSLFYIKNNFLANPDLSLTLMYMKQKRESNIDFFDKELSVLMSGVSWKF